MAGLVAATILTLPYALGAGGFLYYGFRRDHRVCPRCGHGWGRRAERALVGDPGGLPGPPEAVHAGRAGEAARRTWSIMLFLLAAALVLVGVAEGAAPPIAIGVASAVGGVLLHRSAKRAREERRAALISSLQTDVLKLAGERGGRLTVTDVAASLGWPLRRAERVLQSLDDGWRVDSAVTDDGVILYEFRELRLRGDRPTDASD